MAKFVNRLAFFISIVASPFIIIPVFSLIIISFYAITTQQLRVWDTTLVLFAVIIPIVYTLHGVKTGKFSDYHLMVRQERNGPFLVAFLMSLLLIIAFSLEQISPPLLAMAWVFFCNTLIFLFITRYWKISIHVAALTSFITLLSLLVNIKLAWLLCLVPVVMWARIHRQRHTFWQVISAAVIAGVSTILMLHIVSALLLKK